MIFCYTGCIVQKVELSNSDQPILEPTSDDVEKKLFTKQKRILVASLCVLAVLFIAILIRTLYPKIAVAPNGFLASSRQTDGSVEEQNFVGQLGFVTQQEPQLQPVPTPFEFQELTIPYLRNREYTSKLGELKQVSRTANYTSYLTSYDSDGLKVNGLLTVPNGEQPESGFPAVVFVHGYISPTLYRTTENYAAYVNYLANRGIMVFKIDLRGHDQSEGEANGAYYSSDYVIDVLNAYSTLQADARVNPNKIGLWGHSMAGNVLFRVLAVKQHIPKVVIWAGAVYTYQDFGEYGIDDNSYRPPDDDSPRRKRRQQLIDTYGEFNPDSWFWQQVPATNYLDGVSGDLQIHHAVNDDVVAVGYSRNLMSVLDEKGAGIQHELFEYQSGGHNISGAAFNQAMQRTVEFFLGE